MYSCLSLTRPLSSRRWPATPGCGRSPATAGSRPCRPTGAAASAADKIAQDFEPGVRYSECRVSLFLGALHADMRRCAAISSTRSSCPAPMASTGAPAVLCFRPRRMSSGLKHSQPGRDGRLADSQRGGPYSMCQQPANAAAGNLAQVIHSGVARNAARQWGLAPERRLGARISSGELPPHRHSRHPIRSATGRPTRITQPVA